MPKVTPHLNGHHHRSFPYEGKTITTLRPTNRDRERFRKLLIRLNNLNLGYTGATISEFAAAVIYTISGDEEIWSRPLPEATDAELATALDQWLDVDAGYIDLLFLAQEGKSDPVTSPAPLAENASPNS